MPYRKRRRRRRRRRKKMGLSRAAYRLAKKAYASTDHELKYFDASFDEVPVVSFQSTTAQQVFQLNAVPRGTAASERIGQQLQMKGSYMQLTVEKNPNDVTAYTQLRLALVYDREPNQVAIRANALWDNSGFANTSIGMNQPRNLNDKYRFYVLWDQKITLSDAMTTAKFLVKFKKLHHPTRYTGTAGTVGQTSTGVLWLFAISRITEGGNTPSISGIHRLRYVG